MLPRKRLLGGAFASATALLALMHAWRSPASSPDAVAAAGTPAGSDIAEAKPGAEAPAVPPPRAGSLDSRPTFATGSAVPSSSAHPTAKRALRAARAHLRTVASQYGLDTGDVAALEHRDTYVGDGSGARVVRFRQAVGGRPIVGREVSVILSASDEPLGVTGRLAPSTALRRAELGQGRTLLSARDALSSVANDGQARVHAVAFDRDGELVPAHQIDLEASTVIVSAIDGTKLLSRSHAHADAFRVYADAWSGPYDSPVGTNATPHPTGQRDGYAPVYVAAELVTLTNHPFSRNDPWLPPAATTLSGNAVFSFVDRAASNGFDPGLDLEVPATAPGVFDYAYDPNLSPTASDAQRRAAATHLFFVTSYLHDTFYDSGFDESGGNAQASNFGRGGLGDDRLVVAASAHGLEDRSLAIIPPDGTTPRLSFGIYRGTGGRPDRDGTVDTTLIAHEWGHLLAERLVGNGIGLGNGQGRAISEGTADFVSLLVTIRPEDVNVPGNHAFQGVYAVGGYVASASDANGHYFGLRRVPYSTDTARNALSFAHVAAGAMLPTSAPMRASIPADNALPHNAGEVWATALLECYASLLRAYPFAEAQGRMRGYLVAGLRATPFEPTFAEAESALRWAAGASDPADEQRFATAFAKRGLGAGAASPPRASTDLVGITESFATQDALRVVGVELDDTLETCDADGVLDVGETGRLRVTIENVGRTTVYASNAVVSTRAGSATVAFPNGSDLFFPTLAPGARATASLSAKLESTGAFADLRIAFATPAISSPNHDLRRLVNQDESFSATTDTMSTRKSTLAFERNGVRAPFVASHDAADDFAHLEDGPARGTSALVTGPLQVTAKLGVSFRMRHSLVADGSSAPADGAVIEISEDGVHFEDVTKSGANPGYGGTLAGGTTNPLGARAAFTGMSAGFPAFVSRTLDLGNAYTGKTVVLRFRVGASGANASAYGLDIDDLNVSGVAGTPFAGLVAEASNGTVCNRAPIADAGDDVVASQFAGDPTLGVPTIVNLSATRSFDPDGTPLTYAWTQLAGPAATLSSTTQPSTSFAVPAIASDTVFVLQLAASDGVDTTTDTVRVTVRRDNRGPSAVATAPTSVGSGASVVLDGSASSDPDGDALTYTWKQTSGPAVTLLPSNATTSFTAPLVTADTKLAFSLEVSDGIVASAPATVEVSVRAATAPDAGGPPPSDGGPPPSDGGLPIPASDAGGTTTTDDEELATADGADGDGGGCATASSPHGPSGWKAWNLAVALGLVVRRRRSNAARS